MLGQSYSSRSQTHIIVVSFGLLGVSAAALVVVVGDVVNVGGVFDAAVRAARWFNPLFSVVVGVVDGFTFCGAPLVAAFV